MTAKIFNCHHVTPQFAASTELFVTLVSGMHDSPDGSYIGDLGGSNIAQKNVFSEYRHQYFVWKNLLHLYDYVGFEHYRRMFFIDPMTPDRLQGILPELLHFRRAFASEQHRSYLDVGPDAYAAHWRMRQAFTDSDTIGANIYFACFDVIVQRAEPKMTIKEQWDSCMPVSYWNIVVETIKRSKYFRDRTCYVDFNMSSPVWNNMYIMRSEIFDEYMRFFMDCVERMSPQLENWHRAWGHCGERIFNFFLFQKMIENPLLRVGRLPFILRSPEYVQAQPNQTTGKSAAGGQMLLVPNRSAGGELREDGAINTERCPLPPRSAAAGRPDWLLISMNESAVVSSPGPRTRSMSKRPASP